MGFFVFGWVVRFFCLLLIVVFVLGQVVLGVFVLCCWLGLIGCCVLDFVWLVMGFLVLDVGFFFFFSILFVFFLYLCLSAFVSCFGCEFCFVSLLTCVSCLCIRVKCFRFFW